MRKEKLLVGGYTAWLETDDDGGIRASYRDAENLLDEVTYTIREEEIIGEWHLPEQTDIDSEQWGIYWDALVAWVSDETGIAREVLDDAWHPDVPEPFIKILPTRG